MKRKILSLQFPKETTDKGKKSGGNPEPSKKDDR